ncbi:chromatin organization modifier domain-containing protein [Hirsutella rhossiliensis]
MQEITDLLRTNLLSAQASQEQFANANRSPAPAYRVGDMITSSLALSNRARAQPHSYQLKLPHELDSIHNSFHTNLLRPSPNDRSRPIQHTAPPITLDAKGEKLWAIEEILDSKRTKQKGFQYHILWRGFDLEQATWEPLHNVVNAHIAIKEFEKHNKNKPRPTKQEAQNARLQAQQDVEESEAME